MKESELNYDRQYVTDIGKEDTRVNVDLVVRENGVPTAFAKISSHDKRLPNFPVRVPLKDLREV